jgi:undecaprenyl-diphosphatase
MLGFLCLLAWAAVAVGFYMLAAHVETGRVSQYDLRLMSHLRDLPDWFEKLAHVEQRMGQPAVLAASTCVLALWLLLRRAPVEALLVVGAFLPFAATIVVKHIVQETPPYLTHPAGYHGLFASNFSFPSGHVVGFMVLGGLVIAFAKRILPDDSLAELLRIVCVFGIATVGLARVYDEAHYPSDVAAGYALALLYLIPALFAYATWRAHRPFVG